MTIAKYRVLGIHLFFLLAFSECGAIWSVDSLLSRDRVRLIRLGPAWPRRLMQILVCSIYLGGTCAKWHLGDFVAGDQIVFSLLSSGMSAGQHSMAFALHPIWAVQASIATLIYESSFPLLIWVRRIRPFVLLSAVAFHLGIACLMSLNVFSYVMLVAILAFVDEQDLVPVRRGMCIVGETFRRWTGRRPAEPTTPPSPTIIRPDEPAAASFVARWSMPMISLTSYFAFAVVAAWLSFLWDEQHDRYAVYHPQPAPTLKELPVDEVEAVLSNQPAPLEDYFHRLEIGTRLGGRHAFGESHTFRPGMTVFVAVRLLIPHPAFVAQLHLIGPDGTIHARQGMQVGEVLSHVSANVPLNNDLPAGEYQLHWIANGEDIYQRSFELQTQK